MAYGDFKDLPRRKTSDEVLPAKTFNITKLENVMDISVDVYQWFTI